MTVTHWSPGTRQCGNESLRVDHDHDHHHHHQLPSVRKMLSQWSLLPVMVLAQTDIDPHLDLVEDNWSQYRAIVNDGGFLYNDSFILVNDYDQSPDGSLADITHNASLDNLNQPLPKLGFENTLMGMVNALQEIQSKGDQMMTAISDQKSVLVKLRSRVVHSQSEIQMEDHDVADVMKTQLKAPKSPFRDISCLLMCLYGIC